MFRSRIRSLGTANYTKNYYSALGLKLDAGPKEIRGAYLSLAKQHHPDSSTGNSERFKTVAEAYEMLSDPLIREEYDRIRFGRRRPSTQKKDYWEDFETKKQSWKTSQTRTYADSGFIFRGKTYGYEYYDPYGADNERYTYSQFKRDQHMKCPGNKVKGKRWENSSEKKEETSFVGFVFLILMGGLMVWNMVTCDPLKAPEAYKSKNS